MTFGTPKCPTCGDFARGTVETIPGVARLDFDESGEAEWSGETDVDWDGQTTMLDDHGHVTLFCRRCGTEWKSAMAT